MPHTRVRMVALTRPSSVGGVTDWRRLIWATLYTTAPAPTPNRATAVAHTGTRPVKPASRAKGAGSISPTVMDRPAPSRCAMRRTASAVSYTHP